MNNHSKSNATTSSSPSNKSCSKVDLELFYFPDYTQTNPYQLLLYSACDVNFKCKPGELEQALMCQLSNKYYSITVFHLHWVDPIYKDASEPSEFRVVCEEFLRQAQRFKQAGGIFVWTLHNVLPHDKRFAPKLVSWFHEELAKAADLIHVHSSEAITAARRHYRLPGDKCVVVPHGSYEGVYANHLTRDEARRRLNIDLEDFVFCFLGQLRPYKGLDKLVDSFVKVKKVASNVKLLIAGKPVYPTAPLQWTNAGRLIPGLIVHEGYIPDDEIQTYLKAADVAVFPYTDILTSGSIALAASYGVPVIVPDLSTLASIVEEEFVESYCPTDEGSLTSIMNVLRQRSSSELRAMQNAALRYASETNWDVMSPLFISSVRFLAAGTAEETIDRGGVRTEVQVRRPMKDDADSCIGVAIVDYFSIADTVELVRSLPKTVDGIPVRSFIFDNSCDRSYSRELHLSLRESYIISGNENFGFAAGNNYLFSFMEGVGAHYVFMLNPDVRIERNTIRNLLEYSRENPNYLLSPLVMRDDTRISFAGAIIQREPDIRVVQLMDGKVAPHGKIKPYEVQALNGCSIFFPLSILERCGQIPEDYFLYYEETAWCILAAEKGVKCFVVPDSRVTHYKVSQKDSLPALYYAYYLTRNASISNLRLNGDADAGRARMLHSFIEPWQEKLLVKKPEYLALFNRAVCAGLSDGKNGIQGRVDLIERLQGAGHLASSGGEVQCEVVHSNSEFILGWARELTSSGEEKSVQVWLVINDVAIALSENVPIRLTQQFNLTQNFAFLLKIPEVYKERISTKAHIIDSSTGMLLLTINLQNSDKKSEYSASLTVSNFKGKIEGVKNGRLRGWIADVNNQRAHVCVDIVVGGELISGVVADCYRDDLKKAGIGDGCHGYEVGMPNSVCNLSEIKVSLRLADRPHILLERQLTPDVAADSFNEKMSFDQFMQWSFANEPMRVGAWVSATELIEEFNLSRKSLGRIAKMSIFKPLVTVVMPVFNRENIVHRAIKSVLDQTYDNWELIIVDDGSTDRTVEVVERTLSRLNDDRISFLGLHENEGVSAARNVALYRAAGDLIFYLDSDNIWYEECLAIFVHQFENNPAYECAYAGQEIWEWLPYSGRNELRFVRVVPFNRSRIESKNFIDLNVFAHRRVCLDKYGYFEERMSRLVDWEFIARMTKNRPPLFIPSLLNQYFVSAADNQITSTENYARNRSILDELMDENGE